ncbi:MAG: sigma-54 dependent transcriptional regulator [Muribaculaceae bacterium]|nr:sigma-54 dependent transcriptional regulator [Muribaculaceae bacterium]
MNNTLSTPISPQVLQAKQRFGIIGNAPALTAAVERAIRVAPIDLSVLVTGESGTGKEFFPQIIHAFSARKHAKYIAVNCGAIPEGTIDSELFGHEKGAFTGAVDSRKGYFEEASGGTIFLDEVAELPLTTQARLLRVLESGEFIKVGSSTVQKTNIRVVAATNVDLLRAVADGRFREDLYYRLSTVQIHIPPLRDRGTDIRLLARKFAADFAERYRVPAVSFSENADEALRHYRWPGNVRQLKNVVEQIALFEAGREVDAQALRAYLPDITASYMPVAGGAVHSYEREREMLLGMVFKLQQRLDRMQEQLDSLGVRPDSADSIFTDTALYAPETAPKSFPTSLVVRQPESPKADGMREPCSEVNYAEVVDIPPSLEANERELIRRALERNEGRRKAAAADLRISERTLYRKIKEYGLE